MEGIWKTDAVSGAAEVSNGEGIEGDQPPIEYAVDCFDYRVRDNVELVQVGKDRDKEYVSDEDAVR